MAVSHHRCPVLLGLSSGPHKANRRPPDPLYKILYHKPPLKFTHKFYMPDKILVVGVGIINAEVDAAAFLTLPGRLGH